MATPLIKIPLTETEKEVLSVVKSRHVLGRKRYGEGISFSQFIRPEDAITEAIEEAADMLQYLVAFKMWLERRKK